MSLSDEAGFSTYFRGAYPLLEALDDDEQAGGLLVRLGVSADALADALEGGSVAAGLVLSRMGQRAAPVMPRLLVLLRDRDELLLPATLAVSGSYYASKQALPWVVRWLLPFAQCQARRDAIAAVGLIGKVGIPAAVAGLMNCVADEPLAVEKSLAMLGVEALPEILARSCRLERPRDLACLAGAVRRIDASHSLVEEALASDDWGPCCVATLALAERCPARAWESLLELMDGEEKETRIELVSWFHECVSMPPDEEQLRRLVLFVPLTALPRPLEALARETLAGKEPWPELLAARRSFDDDEKALIAEEVVDMMRQREQEKRKERWLELVVAMFRRTRRG